MKYFCTLLVLAITVFSCTKDKTVTPPDLGYDYYPGKIKSYIVYDVDSVTYNSLRPVADSLIEYKFQIKEVFDSLIADNQNRPTIKIIRYKKKYNDTIPYSAMTWTLQDVWAANKTTTNVEVVEENIRYTKLAFPAGLNNSWNGTAHADSSEVDFKYITFDTPLSLGGLTFPKTATIKQDQYQPNLLYYQNYREQYARGVGLIYKEITDYKYYQDAQGVHPGNITDGIHYVMTINSYGTE